MYTIILHLLFLIFTSGTLLAKEITTIFGAFEVNEPVLLELLETNAMQRLKGVQQHGTVHFVRDPYDFTRYEHSVGVCMLCRMFGASLQEQVAALLHDASHTVFSHVGDWLFDYAADDAYQDAIHEWYIAQTDALKILEKHGMAYVVTEQAKGVFKILEQDLPDLCADRLEYGLHTGLLEGLITHDELADILSHVKHMGGYWYFDDVQAARLFADVTVRLTYELWGASWNSFVYHRTAAALKRAVNIGFLAPDDIHFGVDAEVWQKLKENDDVVIVNCMKQVKTYEQSYILSTSDDYDYYYKPKCRAVNPLVKCGADLLRLSEVDSEYAGIYEELKKYCSNGFYLKYMDH